MRASTVWKMVRSGKLRLLRPLQGRAVSYYQLCFLGAAVSSGALRSLAAGRRSLAALAADLGIPEDGHGGLAAWLDVGVSTRVLRRVPEGYALRGRWAQLGQPDHDDLAALLEEMVSLHHELVVGTPARLREGRKLTLADQDGTLVARSSRVVEPLLQEAIRDVIAPRGEVRLLEIGCGSGAHIRFAAQRNPDLTALGLELQPEVARVAEHNLASWGLSDRVRVEAGDVRDRPPEAGYDVATLHQNVYYFPEDERGAVFRHVRGFLRPGGRLLVTTACRGGSPTTAALSLWGAVTEGCSPLPSPEELVAELREAGFTNVKARNLAAPLDKFYAFVGTV